MFGADLPVEGDQGCQFSWCDGPLLLALKSGSWIVLDEVTKMLCCQAEVGSYAKLGQFDDDLLTNIKN